MYILRLLGRGVAAGADRPHRFVGHYTQLERAGTAQFQHHVELARDHFARAPRVAICQLLADAQDRYQALGMRRAKLARYELIALAIQQAPLGVADDHVLAAHILEHGGRDFTGEGALRVRAHILAAETEHRAAQHPAGFLQIHERRAYHARRNRVCRAARQKLLDELRILAARPVHLPVSGNNRAAHGPTSNGSVGRLWVLKGRGMIAMQGG